MNAREIAETRGVAIPQWSPACELHLPRFDEQHKRLFELAARLHEIQQQGVTFAEKTALLEDLKSYTATHFVEEEIFMARTHYPKFKEHKADHDGFTRMLTLEFEHLKNSGNIDSLMVVRLADWLTNHIMRSDREYAERYITYKTNRNKSFWYRICKRIQKTFFHDPFPGA